MSKRFYPISEDFFNNRLLNVIESSYVWRGRPPRISHYKIFCAAMYVLRTGISWRDLPSCYGNWNHVYQRVKRFADRGVWWKMLFLSGESPRRYGRLKYNKISSSRRRIKGGFKVEVEASAE